MIARDAVRREYILAALREHGCMYPDGAEAYLREHEAVVEAAARAATLEAAARWFDRYDTDSARELRRLAADPTELAVAGQAPAPQPETAPDAEVAHVVADSSDDPEHVDDCPGCEEDVEPGFVVTARNPREAILRVMALGADDAAKAAAYTEAADRAATAPDAGPGTPDDGREQLRERLYEALAHTDGHRWVHATDARRDVLRRAYAARVDAVLAVRDDTLADAQRAADTAEHVARQNLDHYRQTYRALMDVQQTVRELSEIAAALRQRAEAAEQRITPDAIADALAAWPEDGGAS